MIIKENVGMEKILHTASIVVTFNRKEPLKKNIEAQFEQNCLVETIFVIDNASSDGTSELFYTGGCFDRPEIKYINTGKNLGGAGGFEFGLRKAYEAGYDWFLLMDDDGRPYDENCFGALFSHIRDQGYSSDQKVFLNSLVLCSDNELTFTLGNGIENLQEFLQSDYCINGVVKNHVNPFNGTLISRGLVDEIGFPNGQFFIRWDEVDYAMRASLHGAIQETVLASKYYHPKAGALHFKKILRRKKFLSIEAPWKEYYNIRNYTYSILHNIKDKKEAKKKIKWFYRKKLYCILTMKCQKLQVYKMVRKGYTDGKNGRLGIRVLPN